MSYYAKTILSCYPSLTSVINQIENVIKKRVKYSFYDYSSTLALAQKLLALSDIKEDLTILKEVCEFTLNSLNEEDVKLIKYKYFKIVPKGDFDHTSRNYFRKQNKALERFSNKLKSNGYTEEWFISRYMKITFVAGVYNKVVSEEGKKHSL